MVSGDVDDRRETVARRAEFVELLDERGTLRPRDVVDELDHSRSTVTRALRELRDAGLVEKRDGGYAATVTGAMAVEEFRRHEARSRAVLTATDLLDPLPDPASLSPDLLAGGETFLADESAPFRPLEAVTDRVREAEAVRAYLPTLLNPSLLRVWHRKVTGGVDAVGVFDEDLLTLLRGQYPQLLAEMGAAEAFSAATADGPPYSLLLTEADGTTTVSVVVHEDDGGIRGAVVNDAPAAVEWAEDRFGRISEGATPATDDLAALAGAVEDGVPELRSDSPGGGLERDGGFAGHALPLDLDREGFVRLSKEFFESRERAPPEVSWRTGFTLAEVRAGHAVDRRDDDHRDVVDRLVGALRDGDDHVVLGPPGAGKSTVCMSVACEWYDRRLGPVLYRERGTGSEFASPSLLEAYLREADDHALVVVEDAIRADASTVFEVMRSLDGRADVTFLLDSRTSEWESPNDFVADPRLDAHRRTAIEEVVVPELDEDGCERFAAHFDALVEGDVGGSVDELRSAVSDGAGTAATAAPEPGRALLAQAHLSRRVDPFDDGDGTAPNALDADVRRTYRSLVEADPEFATDLGVLVTLCTAAGIPVAREYLHAVAPDGDRGDVAAAISALEGRVLFEHRSATAPRMEYRTHHETWSRRFLEQLLELLPEDRARETFGRCVSRLLSLAADADRRDRIERRLDRTAPHLHRIESDPGGWADEVLERVFALGQTHSGLAPLYGETDDGTIDVPDVCSAFVRWKRHFWRAEMNGYQGNLERARAEVDHLLDLDSSVDGLTEEEARRLRFLGHSGVENYHRLTGDYETAADCARRSLALAEGLDDARPVAQARLGLAVTEERSAEVGAAREQFVALRRLADDHDLPRMRASATLGMGRCSLLQGRPGEAEPLFRTIVDREAGSGGKWAGAMANVGLGWIALLKNDLDAATAHLKRALEGCRSVGASMPQSRVHSYLARVARKRGDLDEADAHLERASEHTHGVSWLVATTHSARAALAFDRGALDAAAEIARDGLDVADVEGAAFEAAELTRTLARIALRRGDVEDALSHLDRSREASEALDNSLQTASCDRIRARLELARDDCDGAEAYARQGLDRFREVGVADEAADCLRVLGLVALDRGETERAAEHLHDGLERARESGVVVRVAELHEAVARLQRTGDDPGTARDHLESASAIYSELGDDERARSVRDRIDALEASSP